jgi:uncharacterized phage infection (PIP) family protein YhgE
MKRRTKLAWLVVVAVLGLTLVPAMDASALTKKQRSAEKKQNKKIQRALNGVATVGKNLATLASALDDEKGKSSGIDARLKVIEGGVPQVFDALTKLADAAAQLKTGLETAGAGLTSLKTLATSQEYGFGQVVVLVGGTTPTPEGGSFIVTPDIPDAVQQAQTQQDFVAQHTGTLIVSYGVRSNETDGTGASNPAALCRVFVRNKADAIEQTAANGALGGLPFQPVNTKSPMTSTDPMNTSFPFGLKTVGPDADVTQNLTTMVAVTAGDPYTVGMSCVDTSPSTTDPSA